MKRITSFNLRNVIKIAFGLPVVVSNRLCFIVKLSASGLHTNKQVAADGTGSVPLRLGHWATTEISR